MTDRQTDRPTDTQTQGEKQYVSQPLQGGDIMKTFIAIKPKFIGIDKYKQKVKQLQRLSFVIVAGVSRTPRDFIILLGF